MIQLFKFCIVTALSSQAVSHVDPKQPSCIHTLSERLIRYGDLASWNQDNSCRTIDLDASLCHLGISYTYTENEEIKQSLERATAGNAVVYLLPEVVIKELGEDESKSRRKKDELASQIIQENMYDRLEVPSSCIQDRYSINKRLPIMNFRDSGSLYYLHPNEFTQAVEQFVHLSMEVPLTDTISTIGSPRFDNVVPYLTEENGKRIGKLGLVDLEHFSPEKKVTWEMARDLIQFFPHHYENIVNIIRKFHPEWMEQQQKEFQVARNTAIKYFLLLTFDSGLENSDIVAKYLEKGAISIDVLNDTLEDAAGNGLTKLVKKLLEQNISSSKSRDQALLFAAEFGHEDIVKILLERGGLSSEYRGRAVIRSARNYPNIAKMLLKTGSIFPEHRIEALDIAGGGKDVSLVEMLLEGEDLPSTYNKVLLEVSNGLSHPNYASYGIYYIKLLLGKGYASSEIRGEVLIRAVLAGNKDIVKHFLKQKDIPLDFKRDETFELRLEFVNEDDVMDLLELLPSKYREEAFYRAVFAYVDYSSKAANLSDKLLQRGGLSSEFLGEVLVETVEHLDPRTINRLLKTGNIPLVAIKKSLDIAIKNEYKVLEKTLREAENLFATV